jgi:[acyl-carrier-protein] S-malonyltransferase
LCHVDIINPVIPVVANITGEPYKDAADIKAGLANQLVDPVLWQNGIEHMVKTGIKVFYDMGPRSQLKTMNRHINRVAFKSTVSIEC